MKIIVSTHQGTIYNEDVDYIVVHSGNDGEFGIMNNHIPVVSILEEGYIKLVKENNEYYVGVYSGILEFHDNKAMVLVQEAHIGNSPLEAKNYLEEIRKERQDRNKQEIVDFTKKEKELRDHLKNANAGNL